MSDSDSQDNKDIYSTPESDLRPSTSKAANQYGSVENALVGDYELSFSETLSEAWSLTKGAKTQILLSVILMYVCLIGFSVVTGFILPQLLGETLGTVAGSILNMILMPIQVGVAILGIRRAVKADIKCTSIFNHFDKTIPLFLTALLMTLLILLGFALLIIPGIYLAFAYSSALPLVLEKGMSPWQALETSRKALTHRWFTVFFVYFVMIILMSISSIPLLIGLIWTIPMFAICAGIIYRNVFGVENETLEAE